MYNNFDNQSPSYSQPPSYNEYSNNNSNQNTYNSAVYSSAQNGFAATYAMNPPNMYTNMLVNQQTLIQHRRLHQQKMLEQNYPVKYVIAHSALVGILGIVAIALQIVMIINKTGYYWYGSGIWCGVGLLISISIALLIIQKRNTCLYTLAIMFHFICMIITFSGLVILNIYGATGSRCATINSIGCPSNNYSQYSYAMIGIGAVCSIATLAFTLAMHCMMRGVYGNANGQVQNQNDANMGMNMAVIQQSAYSTN